MKRDGTPSRSEMRVLIYVLGRIQFDNRVPSIAEIRDALYPNARSKYWVVVCMRNLKRMKLIDWEPRANRTIVPKCRIEFFPESGLKPKEKAC